MQNETAPKSPELKKLTKHIAMLDDVINNGWDVAIANITDPLENSTIHTYITEPTLVEIRDALDWVLTFLENRRDYHKKRQTKAKVEQALMEEKLREAGVDIDSLRKDAVRLSEDALLDQEEN